MYHPDCLYPPLLFQQWPGDMYENKDLSRIGPIVLGCIQFIEIVLGLVQDVQ